MSNYTLLVRNLTWNTTTSYCGTLLGNHIQVLDIACNVEQIQIHVDLFTVSWFLV